MNKDAVINRIAHATGCSRNEVLATLKQFGMVSDKTIPSVKKGS